MLNAEPIVHTATMVVPFPHKVILCSTGDITLEAAHLVTVMSTGRQGRSSRGPAEEVALMSKLCASHPGSAPASASPSSSLSPLRVALSG